MEDADLPSEDDPRVVLAQKIAALLPADDFDLAFDTLIMQIVACLNLAPDARRQEFQNYVVGFLSLPLDALISDDRAKVERTIRDAGAKRRLLNRGRR